MLRSDGSMIIKAEKTFEEIVERIVALFRPAPVPENQPAAPAPQGDAPDSANQPASGILPPASPSEDPSA